MTGYQTGSPQVHKVTVTQGNEFYHNTAYYYKYGKP